MRECGVMSVEKTGKIWSDIDDAIVGAICLIFGWASATLGHEWFHSAIAITLGYTVSLGEITLTTGSMFVHGEMTSIDTLFVAAAGSVGLVLVGLILIYSCNSKMMHMIGVVFLCRAWIDALPLCDLDGAIVAQSACNVLGIAGYLLAWTFVISEILISGGAIAHTIKSGAG